MRRIHRSTSSTLRRSTCLLLESLETRELLSHTAFEAPKFLIKPAEIPTPTTLVGDNNGYVHHASLVVKPLTEAGEHHHSRHPFRTHGNGGGGGSTTPLAPAPYTPALIRSAYGFNQVSQTGAGQTIAIVDAYDDPTIVNDLHTFDMANGLADPTLIKVMPTGKASYDSAWAMEIALDVEWAHAIAPGATIMLVEASSASYSSLLAAVDYATTHGANQVSMSWGGGESYNEASFDSHFNHPGVTYTASSGDNGAGVSYPAASPYVTSVGGTSLTIDTAGHRVNETAWSGSGGGSSSRETRPAYQNGFTTRSTRGVPDVSYVADPNTGVRVYDAGHWYQVGGTSAGAPQWAGLFALVNQGRAAAGKASIGTGLPFGTNTALYALAGGTSYTNTAGDYYDVTSGNNGGSNATTGYDVVTGLGSPVANKLVPNLITYGTTASKPGFPIV